MAFTPYSVSPLLRDQRVGPKPIMYWVTLTPKSFAGTRCPISCRPMDRARPTTMMTTPRMKASTESTRRAYCGCLGARCRSAVRTGGCRSSARCAGDARVRRAPGDALRLGERRDRELPGSRLVGRDHVAHRV